MQQMLLWCEFTIEPDQKVHAYRLHVVPLREGYVLSKYFFIVPWNFEQESNCSHHLFALTTLHNIICTLHIKVWQCPYNDMEHFSSSKNTADHMPIARFSVSVDTSGHGANVE